MNIDAVLTGVQLILTPTSILLILVSVLLGVIVGALPGLSSTMAVALLLPFTLGLEPVVAIAMMAALYCAGTFGGSITAILINAPGAPPAVATALDGYPLAQRGEAGRALGVAAIASVCGGILSLFIFIAAAPLLASVALSFRPQEYFALTLFGLSMLASISGKSSLRNLIAGFFGVLVSTVGIHMVTGIERFTFGTSVLYEGIDFVPVLIGIFAIAEMLRQSQAGDEVMERIRSVALRLPSRKDLRQIWATILRSTGIGTIIGILPAEGTTVAAIMGYNEAKRWSKHPEEFGKGSIEGVAGPEAANNAGTSGAMVPTLALGIPGSGTTAVILAALIMHGFRPGPFLMRENPEILYAIFTAMLIANFAFLFVGLLGAKVFSMITLIPRTFLWPSVFCFAVVGAYAYQQQMFDVWVMLIAGLVGFFALRHGFGPAPFVMGLVLGDLIEKNWSQSMIIFNSDWLRFFDSPVCNLFFIMTAMSLSSPFLKPVIKRLLDKRRPTTP
ncbi:tripartite tricarboxylate transporter permease [Halomonas sp. HP20-15]|uniref:tripartite tricarboxylate transporter permease n=1 Tax=Halomonas sp. HP20-15 TaxID=3085901 RepID=UPI00298170CE|nr:tripartite tricarboxylate transporter permease [Halomonas sp. HP20-15]MDW5378028.1 tripartite tricarboxylate transporter permease [Halomonas sp. HP20-15]